MNENNQAISSYDYDAWGNPMNSTVSEESAYRYTGREYDEETGLHNFRARLYDSTLMRFYQVDPAEQFASPYVYCGNNPIGLVDPDGRVYQEAANIAYSYIGNYIYGQGYDYTSWKPLGNNLLICNELVFEVYLKGGRVKVDNYNRSYFPLAQRDDCGPPNMRDFFRDNNSYYTDKDFIMKNAKPGDLLFFAHHVAIVYQNMGDGTITMIHSPGYNRKGEPRYVEKATYNYQELMNYFGGSVALGVLPEGGIEGKILPEPGTTSEKKTNILPLDQFNIPSRNEVYRPEFEGGIEPGGFGVPGRYGWVPIAQ